MSSKFMRGASILDNGTVPGCKLTSDEKKDFRIILDACTKWGLDYYPTIIQKVSYDQMSEIAAYGGFPERYPHWYWGMQYEELQRGYELNRHRIFELVVNTNPCVIYILASNTKVDNICVVAHATGHNDFFKNNIYFAPTDGNMMNKLANHGARIRKYMDRWGREKVTEFIDNVLRIQTLIDPGKAWEERVIKEPILKDSRTYEHPRKIQVDKDRMYMDPWLNPKEHIDKEKKRIEKEEIATELEIFKEPDKDIFGFLKDHAHLKPWQQDILAMLYEEALYFAPQRITKTLNEGWASYTDYEIMANQGYVSLGQSEDTRGIFEYSIHKMQVLGGKYSTNPYKIGFYLLLDIKERWDKGQFGVEWEECKDKKQKENWNLNLNLGKEKIFEVRKFYNDLTFINEYFTQDFCDKFEFFEWKRYPNGEYQIESRDAKRIKKKLLKKYVNGGLPDIRITDSNHKNKGWLLLQHYADGRILHTPYALATMTSLYFFWKKEVVLATIDSNGDEIVYFCNGTDPENDVMTMSRDEYYAGTN